jgi:hypothetical protein
MTRYLIENHEGIPMGVFEGSDETAALDTYAWDAGYENYADLMSVVGGEDVRVRPYSAHVAEITRQVAEAVGDDGTGDLGVIVEHALRDDPNEAVGVIIAIVREARSDALRP